MNHPPIPANSPFFKEDVYGPPAPGSGHPDRSGEHIGWHFERPDSPFPLILSSDGPIHPDHQAVVDRWLPVIAALAVCAWRAEARRMRQIGAYFFDRAQFGRARGQNTAREYLACLKCEHEFESNAQAWAELGNL